MEFLMRFVNWFEVEPTIALLMTVTAIALFSVALRKANEPSTALWPWIRRIIEASVSAILFLGLLWAFRFILNANNNTFASTHGSFSTTNQLSAQSIWGRPHVQRELGYAHYHDVTVQQEVPRTDPSQPPLYKDVVEHQPVPQNSVLSFRGQVDLTLSDREKGYALYNGYLINATFDYQMMNEAEFETQVNFDFPLSPGQTLFDRFQILVDGEDISSLLRFSTDLVQWTQTFRPHQRREILITYTSRGMGSFYYQIPSQREIRDFVLTVSIDRLPVDLLNYPEGALAPTKVESTADGNGSILTWEMDKAITVAGMGIALPQPEQRGGQVLRVLPNSPYSLTLLGAMMALTLLLLGYQVRFITLALLLAAYCIEYLILAGLSDLAPGFWGSLILGAGLTALLTYFLFRHYTPALLPKLIYGLVAFFAMIYPLSGLLTDLSMQNAFNTLVRVGMIVYLVLVGVLRPRTPPEPVETLLSQPLPG